MINNKQSAYSKDETTISNNGKEVVTHLARENPADELISEMTVVTATSSQKVCIKYLTSIYCNSCHK